MIDPPARGVQNRSMAQQLSKRSPGYTVLGVGEVVPKLEGTSPGALLTEERFLVASLLFSKSPDKLVSLTGAVSSRDSETLD